MVGYGSCGAVALAGRRKKKGYVLALTLIQAASGGLDVFGLSGAAAGRIHQRTGRSNRAAPAAKPPRHDGHDRGDRHPPESGARYLRSVAAFYGDGH